VKIKSALDFCRMPALLTFGVISALSPASAADQTLTIASITSNGSNTSPATAQFVDLTSPAYLALGEAAFANFNNHVNADTVNQVPPNFSLAAAQPVSPQFFPFGTPNVNVSEVLNASGTIAPSSPQEYYSFSATDGQGLNFVANATQSTTRSVQLELFDNNGNLVAVAYGNGPAGQSVLNYTAPAGGTGTWSVAVTSADGNPAR